MRLSGSFRASPGEADVRIANRVLPLAHVPVAQRNPVFKSASEIHHRPPDAVFLHIDADVGIVVRQPPRKWAEGCLHEHLRVSERSVSRFQRLLPDAARRVAATANNPAERHHQAQSQLGRRFRRQRCWSIGAGCARDVNRP